MTTMQIPLWPYEAVNRLMAAGFVLSTVTRQHWRKERIYGNHPQILVWVRVIRSLV